MTRDERNEAIARIDAELKQMITRCDRWIAIGKALQVIAVAAGVWGIWNLWF